MAASDNLQPLQFYHGTEHVISGNAIEPGHAQSWNSPAPGGEEAYNSRKFAYASTDPAEAAAHAFGRYGQVLHVEPIGIPVRDPEDTSPLHPTKFMSRHGWRIAASDAASRAATESVVRY